MAMFGHHYSEEERYEIEQEKNEQIEEAAEVLADIMKEFYYEVGRFPREFEMPILEKAFLLKLKALGISKFWTPACLTAGVMDAVKYILIDQGFPYRSPYNGC